VEDRDSPLHTSPARTPPDPQTFPHTFPWAVGVADPRRSPPMRADPGRSFRQLQTPPSTSA